MNQSVGANRCFTSLTCELHTFRRGSGWTLWISKCRYHGLSPSWSRVSDGVWGNTLMSVKRQQLKVAVCVKWSDDTAPSWRKHADDWSTLSNGERLCASGSQAISELLQQFSRRFEEDNPSAAAQSDSPEGKQDWRMLHLPPSNTTEEEGGFTSVSGSFKSIDCMNATNMTY